MIILLRWRVMYKIWVATSRLQRDLALKLCPAHNIIFWSPIIKLDLFHRNDHHIESPCCEQYYGCYLEGQGHSMTLQQKHVQPITLLFEVIVIIYVKYFLNRISNNEVMGRTRLCWKVMLWPWPSKSDPNVARDTLSQYDDHLCKKL